MQTKKRRLKISRILLAVAVCLWVYLRFFFGEWSPYYKTALITDIPDGRFFVSEVRTVPVNTECRIHNFAIEAITITCKDGTKGYISAETLKQSFPVLYIWWEEHPLF